jgi:hypothetical protein
MHSKNWTLDKIIGFADARISCLRSVRGMVWSLCFLCTQYFSTFLQPSNFRTYPWHMIVASGKKTAGHTDLSACPFHSWKRATQAAAPAEQCSFCIHDDHDNIWQLVARHFIREPAGQLCLCPTIVSTGADPTILCVLTNSKIENFKNSI